MWDYSQQRLGGAVAVAVAGVDGRRAIAVTDEDFVCATVDWWPPEKYDYGTCGWAVQDKVVYDTGSGGGPCTPFVKNSSEMLGFTQGCLPMHRWDELNAFFQKSGARIVFELNALNGRVPLPDGSMGTKVLSVTFSGTNMIRAYAHCARNSNTPKDGNLQSQVMLLNGKALVTDANGGIPRLKPVKVDAPMQPIQ
uniref:Uncharacterized protein n=1 Tax=Leersia perrieri TaxID=77586 RepID=A0A0D9VBV8_9ORYZ